MRQGPQPLHLHVRSTKALKDHIWHSGPNGSHEPGGVGITRGLSGCNEYSGLFVRLHGVVWRRTNFAIFSSAQQRFLMTRPTYTYILALVVLVAHLHAGQAPRLVRISDAGAATLEPSSVVRIAEGTSVRLGIENERNAKYYEIQWYRNNEPLAGATGTELSIVSTSAAFVGSFYAKLSTPCAQITTAPVSIELEHGNAGVVSAPMQVSEIELDDVYPNPVTDKATITFRLPKAVKVSVQVTDLVGNTVATLVNATLPSGVHSLEYVVRNTFASSSMYNVVLEAPGYSVVRPMLVVK